MADRAVRMDLRMIVVTWPADAPRGAVARFCRQHRVSRSWFYEVRARARLEGPVAAATRRRRESARSPLAISMELEEIAVRLRKQLADDGQYFGPITVRQQMLAMGIVAPSISTLARVFTRRGLVVAQPQKRPRASWRRFSFDYVHQCWQLDACEWELLDGTVAVIFQLLDDHSRYLVASHAAVSENSADAIAVVDKAIAAYQVPQLLLSDNGAALNPTRRGQIGALVTHAQQLGVKPISGRPYHPQTQGKNERVHATLKQWLRVRPRARDLAELQAQLDAFDQFYNQLRPHQGLGLRTPAQAFTDPRAVPPDAPEPAPALRPVRALRTRHLKVAANGTVCANNKFIQLGREHLNTHVLALVDGALVTIFDLHGLVIRSVTTTEGTRYYGNGKPKWRRIQRQPSTMT